MPHARTLLAGLAALLCVAAAAAAAAAAPEDRGALPLGSAARASLAAAEATHRYTTACAAPPAGVAEAAAAAGVPLLARLRVELPKVSARRGVRAEVSHASGGRWTASPGAASAAVAEAPAGAEASFEVLVSARAAAAYELLATCEYVKGARAAPRAAARAPLEGLRAAVGVASAEDAADPVRLEPNTPLLANATETASALYEVHLSKSHCNVTVSVAALDGDPDVLVGTVLPLTQPNANWSAQAIGDDSVSIPDSPRKLYVSVDSFTESTEFVIVVSTECNGVFSDVPLANGEPVAGHDVGRYTFRPVGLEGTVRIEVSPTEGDPDIYVSTAGEPGPHGEGAMWRGFLAGADVIEISEEDPDWCVGGDNCTYYVLVKPFGGGECEYSVTASATRGADGNDTEIELQFGVPFAGGAEAGETAYFVVLTSSAPAEELSISVSASEGDPDLYLSLSDPRPSRDSSTWQSRSVGADALTVPANQTCVGCPIYVAVECYESAGDCEFVISASSDSPLYLEDGTVLTGAVAAGASRLYIAVVDRDVSPVLSVSLEPVSGECEMQALVGSAPGPGKNVTLETSWYEDTQELDIPVPPVSTCHGGNLVACTIFVRVTGVTECEYDIVSTLNTARSTIDLDNGVPFEGNLAEGEFEYFRFDNRDGTQVRFRVTTLSGDPDLFVSFPPDAEPHPNAENSTSSSNNYGDDEVLVPDAPIGVYYASVYGFSNVSYTIVAETSTIAVPSYVQLEDGVAQGVDVEANEYRYVLLDVEEDHGDVEVQVTCEYGGVSLYMSDSSYMPTSESFQWTGVDSILVRKDDISPDQYYIGLYAFEQSLCTVTGTSRVGNELLTLTEGVPIRGHIAEAGDSLFYRYYNSGLQLQTGLSIRVTPLYGDVDLYVSTSTHFPRSNSSSWKSTFASVASEVIEISPSDPHYCVGCDFFIAALAYHSNVTYTVTVSELNIVYLLDGEPQRDSLRKGRSAHYNFLTVPDATEVHVDVESAVGGRHAGPVTVYVSRGDSTQFPSQQDYTWRGYGANGAASIVIPQEAYPDSCSSFSCVYKISVVASDNKGADYRITASTGGN